MKTETIVQAMALERHLPYGLRVDARDEFPDASTFNYDLRMRLVGTVSKDSQGGREVDQVSTVLCTSVIAGAARRLGLEPAQIAAALAQAADEHIVNRKFVGDQVLDESDLIVQAIQNADTEARAKLTKKKTSNAGSVRARGKKPIFYKGTSIIKA